MSRHTLALAAAALTICVAPAAHAHGFAGNRFFPGTIAVEDPAAADELALPTFSSQDGENEYEIEWGKRITPHVAFSLGSAYVDSDEEGSGWSNLATGLKWQFLTDAQSETMMSVGIEAEWKNTGSANIREDHTTVAPALYFGHGFGNAGADWVKPFAVTGSLEYAMPAQSRDDNGDRIPSALGYGLTIQYSMPYLAAHVHDYGYPDWVNQLTPLVEFTVDQPVRHRGEERTTGTINPGVLWTGRHVQLGGEAIIPINGDSGHSVGFALQLHIFVDDLFSHSLGRPVFGANN
ncbi:MAG: hypothetical protein QM759_07780 [Terricaulis sp.]